MDRRARPRTTPAPPTWLLQQPVDQRPPVYRPDSPSSSPSTGPGTMDRHFGFRSYHYAATQDTLTDWSTEHEQTAAHAAQHADTSRVASEALPDTNDIISQGDESMNPIVKVDDSVKLVGAIEDTTENKEDSVTDLARDSEVPAAKETSPMQNAVETPADTHSVYIGNLPSAATDEEVQQLFGEHNFLELKSPQDNGAQQPASCAYLVFASLSEARRCIREMHRKQLRDHTLHIAFAEKLPSALVPVPRERIINGSDDKGPRKARIVEAAADPVWVGPPGDLS
ncbi:hypothetical protein B0A48_04857 [Cryoendolithus antarcticus]|uniref:RRM domain-containing protein n=1 Tax=Cryoendolithus antarcticus TaxID=1507870 RepID=A0A1V8TDH7_9PEZI|nr:hypothetical protein B0A48_04857 [Cryoendolithus antarcticus]